MKTLKLINFYQLMALLAMLGSAFPFNINYRGEYLIAAALFFVAYELSDKEPMTIEIEKKGE